MRFAPHPLLLLFSTLNLSQGVSQPHNYITFSTHTHTHSIGFDREQVLRRGGAQDVTFSSPWKEPESKAEAQREENKIRAESGNLNYPEGVCEDIKRLNNTYGIHMKRY